jgi:hypothetical protein
MAYYAVQSPRGFSTEPQIVHVFATEQERDSWVEDHDDAEKLNLDVAYDFRVGSEEEARRNIVPQ